ncbi:MAG: hypothetical protein ACFFCQ_05920, partial [Promethearchaeota archaeon]
ALTLPEEEREEILNPEEMTLLVNITETLENYRNSNYVENEEPIPQPVSFYYPSPLQFNKVKVCSLLERIGVLFPWDDNRAVLRKDNCFYVVYLDNANVKIYSFDYECEANICLQIPVQNFHGWSNENYSDYDLLIIAKIVSLLLDQLPSTISQQISQFLIDGTSGENVFPIAHYYSKSSMLVADEERNSLDLPLYQSLPFLPPPERSSPSALQTQLRNELYAAFHRIQTNEIDSSLPRRM